MNKNPITHNLIDWYNKNKRDLPWRKTNNPYYIYLSEIMLQQTQVTTVINYYNHFIEVFPTIESLANANLEDVYKCWEGLGYYSRARNLQACAKQIQDEYQGIFPQAYEDLIKLKGIGPYTASAITSIAFKNPKGVVDGNVLRVFARYFNLDDNIALEKTKKKFQSIVDTYIDIKHPDKFNQGLMDLGATICKPKNPQCDICPLKDHCLGYHENKQNLLPVNIKKIKHHEKGFITCLISYKDQYFLIKNEENLLANLYGLAQAEVESPKAFELFFKERYDEEIQITSYLQSFKHVFTHLTWKMEVYEATFLKEPKLKLYTKKEIEALPISTAHKKILKKIL